MIIPDHSCTRSQLASHPIFSSDYPLKADCAFKYSDGSLVSYNLEDWATGDILLSGPFVGQERFGPTGISAAHAVIFYQRQLDPVLAHHRWWHVGVYNGCGAIVEALPFRHVVHTPVGQWAAEKPSVHRLRLKGFQTDPDRLSHVFGDLENSSYQINTQIMKLLAMRLARTAGINRPLADGYNGEALICSVFVERVLRHAAQREVFRDVEIVTPRDFAAHRDFESMPTFWCRYSSRDVTAAGG
jgi:hypothetical protein